MSFSSGRLHGNTYLLKMTVRKRLPKCGQELLEVTIEAFFQMFPWNKVLSFDPFHLSLGKLIVTSLYCLKTAISKICSFCYELHICRGNALLMK